MMKMVKPKNYNHQISPRHAEAQHMQMLMYSQSPMILKQPVRLIMGVRLCPWQFTRPFTMLCLQQGFEDSSSRRNVYCTYLIKLITLEVNPTMNPSSSECELVCEMTNDSVKGNISKRLSTRSDSSLQYFTAIIMFQVNSQLASVKF